MMAGDASDQEFGTMRALAQVAVTSEDAEEREVEGEGVEAVIDSPGQRSDNETNRIKALAADIRDQDELERNIGLQADQLLTEQANERDQKRLEKATIDRQRLVDQIRKLERRLTQPTSSATAVHLRAEIANYQIQIDALDDDLKQIQERIEQRQQELENHGETDQTGNRRMPNESQRDFLIRTGKITPFSKMPVASLARSGSTLQDVLLEAEVDYPAEEDIPVEENAPSGPLSHRNLMQPGFADGNARETISESPEFVERQSKRRRLYHRADPDVQQPSSDPSSPQSMVETYHASEDTDVSAFTPETGEADSSTPAESHEDYDTEEDSYVPDTPTSKRKRYRLKKKPTRRYSDKEDLTGLDDGNENLYKTRLKSWVSRRSAARRKAKNGSLGGVSQVGAANANVENSNQAFNNEAADGDSLEEWHMPHPTVPDTEFDGGYRIPGDIYPSLFDYQKTGVRWLWELYSQQVGGIIGDEMGLGKTIQVIAFLAGLHYSNKITKPIIVVAPATVMKQWVNEFHTWWPPFRVSILHTSGSGMIDLGGEKRREDELSSQLYNSSRRKPLSKAQKAAESIVGRAVNEGHILVTTYSGLQTYADLLIPIDWEYAILDEGHKIRNPNTAITIYCKELRTANRIILSGTPMQNNLIELWSLFDFIFPMRLGTLVNFRQQFEFPIRQGGYANASNLQVQTASRCAETLKDTISPYLLQRIKLDVAADLPKKSEQVLFCKLTRPQREAYESFLAGDDMKSILNGKRQVLYGIDILRKICNHPDLVEHKTLSVKPGYNYGSGAKSGKMVIVRELLDLWKTGGHKTLLFAQHRIMLDILEKYVRSMDGINYRRMDGNTPIANRQVMVDEFNNNPNAHVFLLTTKVGGLGINLTGADRVIIYDPDWNPSTDIQARERAWRLGQKREVQIYRLMSAGTIEEKIFHRQIFKQFLTNKILRDPKQRQTFQMKDLHDLFTLGRADEAATETGQMFKGTEVRFEDNEPNRSIVTNGASPRLGGETTAQSVKDHNDVRELEGVASVEALIGEDQKAAASSSADKTNSEARIMKGIFARSGVHSALEHDKIINGRKAISADPKIIEREAKKVATEAANELRKAGEVARTVPVGTPTWTGQFGVAGRPAQPQISRIVGRGAGRDRPSSSSILAGLQNRQANGTHTLSGNGLPIRGASSNDQRGTDFMKMIRDYLMTHGGKAYTQMLIDHFNRHCNTLEKTAEFKAMLKEIALLEKGSGGRGAWILKDEYRVKS